MARFIRTLGIMSSHVTTRRLWTEVVIAAILGSGELVLMNVSDTHPGVGLLEFVYPLVAGLVIGAFGRGPVWIVGPAAMLVLPVGMLVGAVTGGTGLNLWPIALVYYGIFAVIALGGAAVGRWMARRWRNRSVTNDA